MRKLKFDLKHCYGIKKLDHELDFSNRCYAIYAPNGVMKTSLAKSLQDYSKGDKPSDLAFPDRETKCEITADGNQLIPENVFVIESYNADYQSDKISTLLANQELKKEYDSVHRDIDKSKDALIKKLKQLSGLTGRKDNIEQELSKIFGVDFFDLIVGLKKEVLESSPLPLNNIQYQVVFNDKVLDFLKTKDFKEAIQSYIHKYDELIEKSPYLGKDFKFHHAETVQKQLSANNFFKGGHSVNLFNGSIKNEYDSDEEFTRILQEEKKKIFSDDDLQKIFDEINNKLSNKELKEFRDYLLDNKEILPEISDLDTFSKKLWLAYLVEQKDLFIDLANKYESGQEEIKRLIDRARAERTDWEEVIRIFNSRFSHLPFHLRVKNKEDVILKSEVETIEFIFKEAENEKLFSSKDELLKILSMGEKRALYILNIIFEVEARKKASTETLFVIDDVADSFDYKNKYAIIEYLKYMSEINHFYMIILTHNFDFFRTVESRKVSNYRQCLISIKNSEGIRLLQMNGLRNPFVNDWKGNLNNSKKLVASIPFVRNLVEYKDGYENQDYLTLTSVLHMKSASDSITVADIESIFVRNMSNITFPTDILRSRILDVVFSAADECLLADEGINLENKIVLSIAIRLRAEQFMKSNITNQEFLQGLDSLPNQTWNLMKEYEEEFNNETRKIEILKRVNLITPENIHINSFMYEPILDMGDGELRELYNLVKTELI